MKSSFQPGPATRRLVDAMLDRVIGDDEFDELARLLAADPPLRSWYCDYVGLDGLITAELKAAAEQPSQESLAAVAGARTSLLGFLGAVVARVPGGEFVVGGLVLLAVSGAVWGVMHFARAERRSFNAAMLAGNSNPAAGPGVGSLATDDQARWADGSKPSDATVRIGRNYELAAGWARIQLTRGTSVSIEGPAVWRLSSDERLQLEVGKLVAEVPPACIGFTIATPTAEVVDLGTEFGVEVDTAGKTDVHVLRGAVAIKPPTQDGALAGAGQLTVVAGHAVRITADGRGATDIGLDKARFEVVRAVNTRLDRAGTDGTRSESFLQGQPIWLGNLFDDSGLTPLAAAMRSDTFRAAAEVGDLGIECVLAGGDAVKQIAPRIRFDATNLGWRDHLHAHVTNDTWSDGPFFVDANGPRGGIRTTGSPSGRNEPRIEEGIGTHANILITFDLEKIRIAGGLQERRLIFLCDRAGINDSCAGDARSSVHVAAIASNITGVKAVVVDGHDATAVERDGVWSVGSPIGAPICGDGKFVRFELALGPSARYLTLMATGAGDDAVADHVVWSGARLEVRP